MDFQDAKRILSSLAEGQDPFSGMPLPADSICNHVEVVRALYTVLGEKKPKKEKKRPFFLSEEQKRLFTFSSKPICITAIVDQLNALADQGACRKLTHSVLTQWLTEIGALELINDKKQPSVEGEGLGIGIETRRGAHGIYSVVTYDEAAQQFLLDNLEAMVEFDVAKRSADRAMQGKPWSIEQEEQLLHLFNQKTTISTIAKEMKRTPGAIRARLQKLNLIT